MGGRLKWSFTGKLTWVYTSSWNVGVFDSTQQENLGLPFKIRQPSIRIDVRRSNNPSSIYLSQCSIYIIEMKFLCLQTISDGIYWSSSLNFYTSRVINDPTICICSSHDDSQSDAKFWKIYCLNSNSTCDILAVMYIKEADKACDRRPIISIILICN